MHNAHLPNVMIPHRYTTVRNLSVWGNNDNIPEVIRLFYKKEYAEFKMFKQETNYKNTSKVIDESNAEFAIINKESAFVENGDRVYNNSIVENCGNFDYIYTDDNYVLYKFN